MKNLYLAVFCLHSITLAGGVYAEPKQLPPIINNSTYASGASYSSQASSNQSMLEMLGQVESLQTEIQKLRGMVEQQGHEIHSLKQRQQNIYSDLNARLQQVEAGAGIATNTSGAETYVAPLKSGQTAVPSSVKQPRASQSQSKANLTKQAQTKPTQLTNNQAKPVSKAEEKAAFDKAFVSVKNSHYQQAIKLLEQFLQDYPNGVYSDNAYFWLGSVYKVVNNIPAAKKNFQAVYTQFPKSEKAGMAMLKLADIYREQSDMAKAQQMYTQITTQYADSTAAHMAEKKLEYIGQ